MASRAWTPRLARAGYLVRRYGSEPVAERVALAAEIVAILRERSG